MTKINYTLADGREVEVETEDDGLARVIAKINAEEQREHWRDRKRRDKSLNALFEEKGFEPIDESADVLTQVEKLLDKVLIKNAVARLKVKEQDLINMVYFQELTFTQIGKLLGISRTSVSRRLDTIHKKLKIILEKTAR